MLGHTTLGFVSDQRHGHHRTPWSAPGQPESKHPIGQLVAPVVVMRHGISQPFQIADGGTGGSPDRRCYVGQSFRPFGQSRKRSGQIGGSADQTVKLVVEKEGETSIPREKQFLQSPLEGGSVHGW